MDQLRWLGVSEDDSEGDVITIRLATPAGEIQIMGEIELAPSSRTLLARKVHVQSDAGPNAIGLVNLRLVASFVLERIDCDEARVEGAARTTGANPGHRPGTFRFAR